MYHMLASTQAHAEEGIARSFHTRKDLTDPVFHFSSRETRLLRDLKGNSPKDLAVRFVTPPAAAGR
jgi:hypothetical protein